MSEPATRLDETELLGQVAWLRRLAATLVADAARADDLTQQVVLEALSRPPPEPSRPRAWLGAVARHLAWRTKLSEGRRSARERMVARPESLPAADEVVARTELHRRVVDAVLALDERYRTALLLRWFDGLPPRAIAERTGEPVETVKTRLKRGLELLRERLIGARGEQRCGAAGEGALALLTLLDRPARSALRRAIVTGGEVGAAATLGGAIVGVLAMGTKPKLLIAAALLVVAGAAATWSLIASKRATRGSQSIEVGAAQGEADASNEPSAAADERPAALRVSESPAEVPAAIAPPAGLQAIRGRVVDEARRPVADAEVVLSITGRAPVVTRSDARGAYTFAVEPLAAVDPLARGSVSASDAKGRAGVVPLFHPSLRDHVDYLQPRSVPEVIVVRPGGELRVRVVDAAGPVAGATVRIELGEERERGPAAISDAAGEARFAALPIGHVVALASSDDRGRGRASGRVALASTDVASIEVALRPTRSIAVRVGDVVTDAPIEGARVTLTESVDTRQGGYASYSFVNTMSVLVDDGARVTDASGRVAFAAVEEGTAIVAQAGKEGLDGTWSDERRSGREIEAGATTLALFLQTKRSTTLHWRIAADGPTLAHGSELRLFRGEMEGGPAPTSARVVGGQIVAEVTHGSSIAAWVQAPDGRLATIVFSQAIEYGGEGAVVFRPGRRLVVRLRDDRGRQLPGVPVVAELGREGEGGEAIRLVNESSDSSGVATFDPLPACPYRLRFAPERSMAPFAALPAVDLTHGDAAIDFTLPAPREAIVEVSVEGVRCLPADLEILNSVDLPSHRTEDAELGELHLWFAGAEGAPYRMMLDAAGFVRTPVTIERFDTPEPPRVAVAFERGATLTVRLLAPVGAVCRPTLQRWGEKQRGFRAWNPAGHRLQEPNTADGAYRFTALPAGRWRVVEEVTGIASPELEIVPGGGGHELTVDLARAITIAGRCELPDDPRSGVDDLELFLIDDQLTPGFLFDRSAPPSAQRVRHQKGVFETWLDGSRRWRLVARTPLHRLATADGTLPITGTQRDLVLRFEERPLARFHARSDAVDELAWLNFSCHEPAEAGAPSRLIASSPVRRDGDAYVLAPPVATFDLVVTARGHASVVRRAVRFDGSPLDLGELVFERGSRLTVNLTSKTLEQPTATLIATRIDDDELARFDQLESYDRGSGVHRLEGLRRGRWRVELQNRNGRAGGAETRAAEIDLDGEHDATIELSVD